MGTNMLVYKMPLEGENTRQAPLHAKYDGGDRTAVTHFTDPRWYDAVDEAGNPAKGIAWDSAIVHLYGSEPPAWANEPDVTFIGDIEQGATCPQCEKETKEMP